MKRIAVFCGSKLGHLPSYELAAKRLGKLMAETGLGLVYGGGNIGLMGAIADSVIAGGGEAIGVIPRFLVEKEQAHSGLSQLIEVNSMHDRKLEMHRLADAFIILPGGFGTMDELFETLTWRQLGMHEKPMGILNIDGFYDSFFTFLHKTVESGFVSVECRNSLISAEDPAVLLQLLSKL